MCQENIGKLEAAMIGGELLEVVRFVGVGRFREMQTAFFSVAAANSIL
jgi:hypothetical protein